MASQSENPSTPTENTLNSGASDKELETSSSILIGEHDLLIIGPGVLGRLVAQKWREEHPKCQIHGQTVSLDQINCLLHFHPLRFFSLKQVEESLVNGLNVSKAFLWC